MMINHKLYDANYDRDLENERIRCKIDNKNKWNKTFTNIRTICNSTMNNSMKYKQL